MKRNLYTLTILALLIGNYALCQKVVKKTHSRKFVSLKSYKELFKGNLSNISPSDYIYRENDTLVPLPEDYNRFEGEKVAYEPKDSIFLETYKDIVFRKYHSKKYHNKELRMHYWKDEIKIYFAKSINKNIKKELKKFASTLSREVDSLKISFVKKVEDSNYIIYSVENEDDFQYNANIKKNKYDFHCNWNGHQQLYKTELQLYPNKHKTLKYQVIASKVYFFRSLGFFNTTRRLERDSYFSSLSSSNKRILDMDVEILKYHYSYGICKGTKLDEFEKQHERAKKLLKEKNRYLYFVHKD